MSPREYGFLHQQQITSDFWNPKNPVLFAFFLDTFFRQQTSGSWEKMHMATEVNNKKIGITTVKMVKKIAVKTRKQGREMFLPEILLPLDKIHEISSDFWNPKKHVFLLSF